MTQWFDRRPVVLACAAAFVLIFPCSQGFGQSQPAATGYTPPKLAVPAQAKPKPAKVAVASQPPPLKLALQHLKQDYKPGVVILVPEEEAAREALARRLGALLAGRQGGQSRATEFLLSEAVFVCVPVAQARKEFPRMPARAAVLLIGQNGKLLASLPPSPALFQEGFVLKMTELLHGRNGERLAATARAQRRRLGPITKEIDAALRDLDSDLFRKREAASGFLLGTAERSTAVLIQARLQAPSLEAKRRIERLLDGVLTSTAWRTGSPLPYGVMWEESDTSPVPAPPNAAPADAGQRCLRFVTRPQTVTPSLP